MDIEKALKAIDYWVLAKTGKRLKPIQRALIAGCLQNWTYEEIKDQVSEFRHYEVSYIKQDMAPKLWEQLTEVLREVEEILPDGEKVSKHNLWATLERAFKRYEEENKEERPNFLMHRAQKDVKVPNPKDKELGASREQDWGEAPSDGAFYGRTEELVTLREWIVNDRCQLVAIVGMGGIGKTTLAVHCCKQIQSQFDYVIWRSLRYAPPLSKILTELIKFLSDGQKAETSTNVGDGISELINYLRSHRCLIILDELETTLHPYQLAGDYRDEYQDYGELLKRVAEASHLSCLLLTSREKPKDVALLQGETLPVRSLELRGLDTGSAKGILQAKGFSPTENGLEEIVRLYRGHPAALMNVATTIKELFDGNISEFLKQNTLTVGDIFGNLLNQQFKRLSSLEKEIVYWLAIEQKPVDSDSLQAELWVSVPRSELMVALESLLRRSLIEKSVESGKACFTLQPVVMKYVNNQLVEQVCQDIFAVIETQEIEKIGLLRSHALVKEEASDEVKEIQIRLILTRVKDKLSRILSGSNIETQLNELLSILDKASLTGVGYALVNIRRLMT